MKLALVTAAIVLVASCHTTATSAVASAPVPAVRVGARTRLWEVRRGEERLGLVVLFQEHGHARDSVYFVRNAWHQDLGLIDGLGRAYRFLPHMEEPAWVGSGTIAVGAQRILGAATECTLVELDPGDPAATAARTAGARTSTVLESSARPSSGLDPDGGLPQYR